MWPNPQETSDFVTFTLPKKSLMDHKWNEAWLLIIKMVYRSCLTNCRTTSDLGNKEMSGKFQNFKLKLEQLSCKKVLKFVVRDQPLPQHILSLWEEDKKEALEHFKHVIKSWPNRRHIPQNKLWNTWTASQREKCPKKEFFLVRIFLYSDQKKLPIWTLFTQCVTKNVSTVAAVSKDI